MAQVGIALARWQPQKSRSPRMAASSAANWLCPCSRPPQDEMGDARMLADAGHGAAMRRDRVALIDRAEIE